LKGRGGKGRGRNERPKAKKIGWKEGQKKKTKAHGGKVESKKTGQAERQKGTKVPLWGGAISERVVWGVKSGKAS